MSPTSTSLSFCPIDEAHPVAIIGGGAAGLFCGVMLVRYGIPVIIYEAQERLGKKLAICGGGYANITHNQIDPKQDYVCANPHFPMSSLKRYPPKALLNLLDELDIAVELRDRGCWFCQDNASHLVDRLVATFTENGGLLRCATAVQSIDLKCDGVILHLSNGATQSCARVVLACGGLACPQIGGTDAGLILAQTLNLALKPQKPALAPLYFAHPEVSRFGHLAGIALDPVTLSVDNVAFTGSLVFRPDGLGGLAVFRSSLAWANVGGEIMLNFLPSCNLTEHLTELRTTTGKQQLSTALSHLLPKRLVQALLDDLPFADTPLCQLRSEALQIVVKRITHYPFTPARTGTYREAEVMLGGVDTDALSSKTLALKTNPHLFLIGEMLDVTGQLGGYNLHWAFASAAAATDALLTQ